MTSARRREPGRGAAFRIAVAMASINPEARPLALRLVEAGSENFDNADIRIQPSRTQRISSMSDGVLGVTEFGGEITIITGWNYYLGADPNAVGADQYDFQTVATHELTHALRLGHGADTESVMFPFLGTAAAAAKSLADDLLLIDNDAAMQPEALLAIPNHPLPATAHAPRPPSLSRQLQWIQ